MQTGSPDLLLVEDNSNDVAVALRALRRNALHERVRVLRDGAEVVDFLLGGGLVGTPTSPILPKVIVLDLKMPRMDGKAVLKALRADERTRRVPIVVVSWSDHEDDVRDCYELGANSFVVKRSDPLCPGEYLVDTVRYWLERNEVAR
jgi:CheY-like chemotaxis protein